MTVTPARPDLTAHASATRLQPAALVAELRAILGARLVAYIGGVKETRAVRQWADGERRISNTHTEQRLRIAYQAAKMLTEHDANDTIQAWFLGLNPMLDDTSPARLLTEEPLDDSGPRVLAAARHFAATG